MANAQTTDGVAANSGNWKQSRFSNWPVAWFVGVLAFLLGSLKSDAIKQAFPLCCVPGINYPSDPHEWAWSGSAIVFWISAFAWAILHGLRLKAESTQAALLREQSRELGKNVTAIQDGTNALQKATTAVSDTVEQTAKKAADLEGSVSRAGQMISQIKEDVQTLPPPNYVTALGYFTTESHTLCGGTTPRQALTGATKADLEPLIRRLLQTVALLAETYDGKGWRYAANVMYFVPSTDGEFESSDVQKCQTFLPVPQPNRAAVLRGALVLRKSLTATAHAYHDDEVQETAFPIPKPYLDDLDQNKFRVLPGAALAYAQSQDGRRPDVLMYCLEDLWTIGKQLRSKYAFDDEAIARIEEEYDKEKQGRWVRSGLSFPLFEVETDDDGKNVREKVIGVLNIHCDQDAMLGGFTRQMLFARTTLHFVNDIAEAMGLWLKLA